MNYIIADTQNIVKPRMLESNIRGETNVNYELNFHEVIKESRGINVNLPSVIDCDLLGYILPLSNQQMTSFFIRT